MQLDKAAHALAGAAIALFVLVLCGDLGVNRQYGMLAGVFAGLAAGFLKERADDWMNKRNAKKGIAATHTVDPKDLWATAGGGLFVMVAVSLVHLAIVAIRS